MIIWLLYIIWNFVDSIMGPFSFKKFQISRYVHFRIKSKQKSDELINESQQTKQAYKIRKIFSFAV